MTQQMLQPFEWDSEKAENVKLKLCIVQREQRYLGIYFLQFRLSFLYLIINTVKNKRWSKRIVNLELIANF